MFTDGYFFLFHFGSKIQMYLIANVTQNMSISHKTWESSKQSNATSLNLILDSLGIGVHHSQIMSVISYSIGSGVIKKDIPY